MVSSDYSNGKIYKIVSKYTEKIYIGSTIQPLKYRLTSHKSAYKHYKKTGDTTRYCHSFKILCYDYLEIKLLEEYPCDSKEELVEREQYYIEKNRKLCVNGVNSIGRTKDFLSKRTEYNRIYFNTYRHCIYCDCQVKQIAIHNRTEKHKSNVKFFESL